MGAGIAKMSNSDLKDRSYVSEVRNQPKLFPSDYVPTNSDLGVSSDSYIYSESYVKNEELRHKLWEEEKELEAQRKQVEEYKPKEEWTELEALLVDIGGRIMRPRTDEYTSLTKEIDERRSQISALEEDRREMMRPYKATFLDTSDFPLAVTDRDYGNFQRRTGMSMYDALLDRGEARVVLMTPRQYLEQCGFIFGSNYDNQIYSVIRPNITEYANRMLTGEKAPLPMLNYSDMTQEGRHRAYASLLLGVDLIPVMIID